LKSFDATTASGATVTSRPELARLPDTMERRNASVPDLTNTPPPSAESFVRLFLVTVLLTIVTAPPLLPMPPPRARPSLLDTVLFNNVKSPPGP
jgi:hypothetical protein